MTLEEREPLIVRLGPRIIPSSPPSGYWAIDVQQPSILRWIMMPLRGVQAMFGTDSNDVEMLKELLRANFERLEAKVTEIATGDWEEDFGIAFIYWDNLPEAARTRMARAGQERSKSAAGTGSKPSLNRSEYLEQLALAYRSGMYAKPDRDRVKSCFPAFAELRDKWGMRTASFEGGAVQWVARLEGDSFDLMLGEDRGDDWFEIRLHGSERHWQHIPTVLHELGLWDNVRERADPKVLADALERNIIAVLHWLGHPSSIR